VTIGRSTAVLRRVLDRYAGRIFAVVAIAAWGILVWMGRGLTFFSDEWAFIEGRSLFDIRTWFAPHNEHWSTIPIVVYRLLMEVVGLRTYLPYLAVLIGLHVLVAAAVFLLLRRWTGSPAALGGGILVLFFGSGFENLFWAFQIAFVAAVAIGLWMVWLLEGPPTAKRAAAVVLLLVLGLATSGLALIFLVVVALTMLLRPPWRRFMPALLVPLLVYLAWYVAIGGTGITVLRNPFSLDQLLQAPWFVAEGVENSIGAVTGLGPLFSGIVFLGLVLGLLEALIRGHRVPVPTIALGVGLILQYALIAVTRAGVTFGQSDYTRYTYLGGILALLAIAAMAGSIPPPAAPARRRAVFLGAALVLEIALVLNVQLLVAGRDFFLVRAQFTRALIAEGLAQTTSDGVDPTRSLVVVPSPDSLRRIESRYGLPLTDSLAGDAVGPPPPWIVRLAELRVRGYPVGP
jgi:hypothetical protein